MRLSGETKKLARSVLAVAQQVEAVDALVARLELLRKMYHDDPSFRHLLVTKRVSATDKMSAIKVAFKDNLGPLEYQLLQHLLAAQSGAELPDVARFILRAAEADGSYMAISITSAQSLSEAEVTDLSRRLEAKLGRSLHMTSRTDPSLIGGIKLRLGNTLIDGTVARRLALVRQELAG